MTPQESGGNPPAKPYNLGEFVNQRGASMNRPPVSPQQSAQDYARVEQAIRYLEAHFRQQPELGELAASAGLSEYHFQRLFTRWVGISPKRFLQYLTKEHAKRLLQKPVDLLEATYASGLSSPGRLHDLFVVTEAVTPGEFKTHGQGLSIRYGYHPTPFGECLMAVTGRGICHLAFVQNGREQALEQLRAAWSEAELIRDDTATEPFMQQIFYPAGGRWESLPLLLRGTNFQIKVWEALLHIPSGSLVTYDQVAAAIGMPGAARAVGQAIGRNPLAVIIPCHRVIRKDGGFGDYRYGSARKKALLGWEIARREEKALMIE
jgi:AraC family transcriptional regulator of adaptative response/methylated-DNA-[protein]-cysteine methyltransferase